MDTRRDAAPGQLVNELVGGCFAGFFVDGNHGYRLCTHQKRHRVVYGAGRQAAAVPGNPNMVGVEWPLVDVGYHQHGPAGIEQNALWNDIIVARIRGVRLQHDREVVKPRKVTNGFFGFRRDRRERSGAIGNLGKPGLDFEHGDRGVRPFLGALLFNPHHGGNGGTAALHHHPDGTHGFIPDGDGIEMRAARYGQRDGDVDHGPDGSLRRNMNQNVPEHRRSPKHAPGRAARALTLGTVTDRCALEVDVHQTQRLSTLRPASGRDGPQWLQPATFLFAGDIRAGAPCLGYRPHPAATWPPKRRSA